MKSIASRFDGNLVRDVAIFLFLCCVMGIVLLVTLAPSDVWDVYLLLAGIAFLAAVLAFFGRTSAGIVLAGLQVCAWTAYKLYMLYTHGALFLTGDFFWLPAPLALVGSVCLFQYGSTRLETENAMLRSQVEDLVMVDPLTGLYNLRALYREITIQSCYCVRHGMDMSLMVVRLRYEQELKAFLPRRRYIELKQRLADAAKNALRFEDRLFAMDDAGSLAIILATGHDGCLIVKNRLRSALEDPECFSGIMDENIMVSVRIAHKLCTEQDGKHPVELKMAVENELQYDV